MDGEQPTARKPIRSFRDLEVYERARQANVRVHRLADTLPSHEKYDLSDQMRRAAKSILANIAEGHALRHSEKEFKRYLRICVGSANEMESHLETARDLGYGDPGEIQSLIDTYQVVGKQLTRLITVWKTF